MTEQDNGVEQLRFESRQTVISMAEVIAGESLAGDLERSMDYLSKSPLIGPRADTPFPQLKNLTDEQATSIREKGTELGIGAEESLGLKERAMPAGTTVICEGGLPNKMLAQLIAVTDNEVLPGTILISASETRQTGDTDVKRTEQMSANLGFETPDVSGLTEFDLAGVVATMHPDFEGQVPTELPIGFDIHDGGVTPKEETTGQVVHIGTLKGAPVVIVGVRELHRDDSGKNFFRPGPAHLHEVGSRVAGYFDEEAGDLPVALMTSHLYGRSRILRDPNTLTYGTKVMDQLVPHVETPLNQIVAEAHRIGEILTQ